MLLNWHPVYSGSDYVDDHQQLLDAFEDRDDPVVAVREHLRLSEQLIVGVVETYSSRLRVVDDAAPTTQEADR